MAEKAGFGLVSLIALGLVVAGVALAAPRGEAKPEDGEPPGRSVLAETPAPAPSPAILPREPGAPRTRAAARVLETIQRIQSRMQATRYQHNTVVRERDGLYAWDCSGMAAWILERSAPRALGVIGRERPVARDFAAAIERAPTEQPRRGWQRLSHIEDAEPGDVFAWRRPPQLGRQITGHVGFVMERAQPVARIRDAYTMRVADATSLPHQDDTRLPDSDGGFGFGTLLFLTDGHGNVQSYGWFGTNSRGVLVTPVVFGRVSR